MLNERNDGVLLDKITINIFMAANHFSLIFPFPFPYCYSGEAFGYDGRHRYARHWTTLDSSNLALRTGKSTYEVIALVITQDMGWEQREALSGAACLRSFFFKCQCSSVAWCCLMLEQA